MKHVPRIHMDVVGQSMIGPASPWQVRNQDQRLSSSVRRQFGATPISSIQTKEPYMRGIVGKRSVEDTQVMEWSVKQEGTGGGVDHVNGEVGGNECFRTVPRQSHTFDCFTPGMMANKNS